jgi:uncharacterized protein
MAARVEIDTGRASDGNGKSTYQMEEHADSEAALRRVETAGNLSISPELFEKLYMGPKNEVTNNLRTTFGNPSPLYDSPCSPFLQQHH